MLCHIPVTVVKILSLFTFPLGLFYWLFLGPAWRSYHSTCLNCTNSLLCVQSRNTLFSTWGKTSTWEGDSWPLKWPLIFAFRYNVVCFLVISPSFWSDCILSIFKKKDKYWYVETIESCIIRLKLEAKTFWWLPLYFWFSIQYHFLWLHFRSCQGPHICHKIPFTPKRLKKMAITIHSMSNTCL